MVGNPAGWYPDPVGRFELRFHNGQAWTSDVASGGRRFIDQLPVGPLGPVGSVGPSRRDGGGLGVASMVCGICAVAIGWMPFVGLLGIPAAIVAVVLGTVALRRGRPLAGQAERGSGGARRGFALTGVITGSVGLIAAAIGVVLTAVVWRLIDEFENPGPVEAELATCTADVAGVVTVEGIVENLSDEERSYSVQLGVTGGRGERRRRVDVEDVPAGGTRSFRATERIATGSTASCRIVAVDGPLPLGIDVSTD